MKLLHIRNSTAGLVPAAASLTQGQLAINTTDAKLYTKLTNNTVVEIGRSPWVTVNNYTASRTMTSADINAYCRFTPALATSITIPPNWMPVGGRCWIRLQAALSLSLVAGSGVTINGSSLSINLSNSTMTLICVATNVYDVIINAASIL